MENNLTVEGLNDFMNNAGITYANSAGKKGFVELKCVIRGGIKVYHNKKVVLETMQPMDAVNMFNELTN